MSRVTYNARVSVERCVNPTDANGHQWVTEQVDVTLDIDMAMLLRRMAIAVARSKRGKATAMHGMVRAHRRK